VRCASFSKRPFTFESSLTESVVEVVLICIQISTRHYFRKPMPETITPSSR
jgi:hypothetical protein